MSQQFPSQQPQQTVAPPIRQKKPWFKRWWAIVLFIVVGLLVLGALLNPDSETTPTTAAPSPAPTVTRTVTEPAPEPETKTVTKEVTPRSCLRALDAADSGFGIASDMIGIFSAALTAVSELDYDEVERQTGKLERLTERLTPVGERYNAEKAECRAAAE